MSDLRRYYFRLTYYDEEVSHSLEAAGEVVLQRFQNDVAANDPEDVVVIELEESEPVDEEGEYA